MSVSMRNIFEHLRNTCGNITDLDLKHNEEKMKKPWNQEKSIEIVFQQLEEAIEDALHENSPCTNNQILHVACVIMCPVKAFKEARREYWRKDQAEKI